MQPCWAAELDLNPVRHGARGMPASGVAHRRRQASVLSPWLTGNGMPSPVYLPSWPAATVITDLHAFCTCVPRTSRYAVAEDTPPLFVLRPEAHLLCRDCLGAFSPKGINLCDRSLQLAAHIFIWTLCCQRCCGLLGDGSQDACKVCPGLHTITPRLLASTDARSSHLASRMSF